MRNWLILISYCIASFTNGVAWGTLIPIPDEAMSYYDINSFEFTMYALLFEILSLPLAPISIWIISESFYAALHLVHLLNLLGTWVRVVAFSNFWVSFTGQALIGCENILILCSCSNLSTLWFPPEQQVLAISIATSANFLGMAFAFIFMPYTQNISLMMWIQAIISSVFFVFNIVVIKKDVKIDRQIGFKDSVLKAMSDKVLMVMTICEGSVLGVCLAVVSTFGLLLGEFGYSDIESGWLGFTFLLSGLFGGLLGSYIANVKNSIKLSLEYFLIMSAMSSLAFAGLVGFKYVSYLVSVFNGVALLGSLPLSISGCIEYMDDIDVSIPTNKIFIFGMLFGTIYTYPIQYSKDVTGISGLWVAGALIVFSSAAYLWQIGAFKGNNLRNNSPEAKDKIEKSSEPLLSEEKSID